MASQNSCNIRPVRDTYAARYRRDRSTRSLLRSVTLPGPRQSCDSSPFVPMGPGRGPAPRDRVGPGREPDSSDRHVRAFGADRDLTGGPGRPAYGRLLHRGTRWRLGPTGTPHREPANIRRSESPSPTYVTEDGEHVIIAKTEDGGAGHSIGRVIVVSTAYRVAWPAAGQHRPDDRRNHKGQQVGDGVGVQLG